MAYFSRSRHTVDTRIVHPFGKITDTGRGPDWLNNHWSRSGASSLANDILMQLQKEADGHYQSADYFSVD